MKKGIVFATSLIIVLIGLFGVASEVEGVKASGTIYIRADGSIDPPTVPISTDDNVTYTFIDNINDSIVIERSHIIIEGVGYTLNGTGTGELVGLTIDDSYNVTIQHVNIEGFGLEGEFLPNTTATILLNNTSYNTIYANTITNNDNYYGIWLENSSSNTISGNNITNNHREGLAYHSIRLRNSSSNTISGNNITNNDLGIWLCRDSNHNSIFGNNITNNNYYGIWLDGSSSNSISGNSLSNNEYGIFLEISSSNTISGNNITNNLASGIYLLKSSDNKFYHNNIIDNTQQVYVETSGYANFWDDGVEGNYWSNYTGADSDHDGIGDSPHAIDANNTDNFPLMGMFHSFNTPLDYNVNVISNSTIGDFTFFESNSTIKMYISNMTATQTFGFCRVCIPKDLMSPPYTVIIDDGLTLVLYFNDTIHDNGTHRWIYFAYEHSTYEVDIIPEFPTWTLLLLILTILTVAIIIYKQRLVRTPNH